MCEGEGSLLAFAPVLAACPAVHWAREEAEEVNILSEEPAAKPETYQEWFNQFLKDPAGVNNGMILLATGIPIALCSVLLGLTLFPPGLYPKFILMAPGLVGAIVLLYILGFILFLNKWIGILIAGLAGLISLGMLVIMLISLYQ